MEEQRIDLLVMELGVIRLGKAGEGNRKKKRFMTAAWRQAHPDAQISLHVTPPNGVPYLAALDEDEDGNVIWTITDADTAWPGSGKIELILSDPTTDTTIKSVTGRTVVDESPSQQEPGEPPEPHVPWWEKVLQLIAMGAGTGGTGVSPTIKVEDITGGHRLTITDILGTKTVDVMDGEDGAPGAQGAAGENGVSPTITVAAITGGHRVTITDVDGAKTFDVMDGQDGSGGGSGAAIDDETPSATTTYSSSKIDELLNEQKEANAAQDTEIARKANDAELAKVAKSGSYNDLTGKPTIPTVPTTLPNPNKLKLTGAVTAEYDGSSEVIVEIPEGGGGSYTLPIASATQLGGVMPAAKTDDMTQAVGVDAEGRLFTAAGAGGGETLTAENTLLAECVIPSGTAQWTKTQTGLTVGNLREYKIFGVILETSSSFLSGMYLGSTRIYYDSGAKMRLLFEWLDSDKRAVHLANGVNGNGYGTYPFVSISAIQAQGLTMGGAGLQIIKSDDHDDAAVTVYNHEALTADATVKIYGVIKG